MTIAAPPAAVERDFYDECYGLSAGDRQQEHVELELAALAGHAARGAFLRRGQHQPAGCGREAQILAQSPAGKVPALLTGDRVIWDSLAILEFLAEAHPEAGFWPASRNARTVARSVSAEMHAGFQSLRQHCPMDFLARTPKTELADETAADVRRIVALWLDCRRAFGDGGSFLFGAFTAADAMYAPVASRFRTYLPDLAAYGDDGTAQAYVEALFALPSMLQWGQEARSEIAARS